MGRWQRTHLIGRGKRCPIEDREREGEVSVEEEQDRGGVDSARFPEQYDFTVESDEVLVCNQR